MDIELRKFGPQDFADYLRLVGNPKVMAMITGRAVPAAEAQRDYEKLLATNAFSPDLGQFRILDVRDGRFIGLAKLEATGAEAEKAELGYMLLPELWGKGIAGRVAGLLIERARRLPALRGLFAIIDPGNVASRRILINNGFASRAFRDFDGLPGEILELDW